MVGAAAVVGGLVGFRPSAVADHTIPSCDGIMGYLFKELCKRSCVGPCVGVGVSSCCQYGDSSLSYACVKCRSGCNPPRARVVVVCSPAQPYYCINYCV